MKKDEKNYIYFDHASTTPIDRAVLEEMYEYDKEWFANPSSLYERGDRAHKKIEEERKNLAQILQCQKHELTFTSGGTESNNLAIKGTVEAFKKNNPNITPHIVVSSIEHASVLDTVFALQERGEISVTYIKPKKNGVVRPLDFIEALRPETILVSLMYVNNEIGTLQPVGNLGGLLREYKEKKGKDTIYPLLHTDACQAGNYFLVSVPKLKSDLITINASKVYGPKGIGALYVKRNTPLTPIMFGGGQENGLRSGTENTALILGLVHSFTKAQKMRLEEGERLTLIRDRLSERLIENIQGAHIWGDKMECSPNTISVHIPGISAEELVIRLSSKGIEVASKSACSSIKSDGSYVILEIGGTETEARETLRITLGRETTTEQTDFFLQTLIEIVSKYTHTL